MADQKKKGVPATQGTNTTGLVQPSVGQLGPQQDPFAKDQAPQLELPRIVLLQPLSAEVMRDEDKMPAGVFINRLTGDIIGKKIEFVAFKQFKTRIYLKQGEGLKCRSTDLRSAQMLGGMTADKRPTRNCEVCVLKLWPDERMELTGEDLQGRDLTGGPACSLVDNYLAVQTGREDGRHPWIVLQFMRTGSAAAKRINGMWLDSEQPLQNFVYAIYAAPVKGEGQAYYRQDASRLRVSNDEERQAAAKYMTMLGADITDKVGSDVSEEAQTVSSERGDKVAAAKGF
jgi:hypothetical protein